MADQDGPDRFEELTGSEDFSEAIVEELRDQKPDLVLDDRAVGNAEAIFQSVFAVGAKDRQYRRSHGLRALFVAAAFFADQSALADGEKTLFERFRSAIQTAFKVRKPPHFPEQFDLEKRSEPRRRDHGKKMESGLKQMKDLRMWVVDFREFVR